MNKIGFTSSGRGRYYCDVYYQQYFPEAFVRRVRGAEMFDQRSCVSEFIASCQLDDNTGGVFPALEESLCYLDDIVKSDSFVIVISDAQSLFRETPESLVTFLVLLGNVVEWWSRPVEGNPPYDREGKSFRFIFEVPDSKDYLKRIQQSLQRAEVILSPIEGSVT